MSGKGLLWFNTSDGSLQYVSVAYLYRSLLKKTYLLGLTVANDIAWSMLVNHSKWLQYQKPIIWQELKHCPCKLWSANSDSRHATSTLLVRLHAALTVILILLLIMQRIYLVGYDGTPSPLLYLSYEVPIKSQ